MIRISSEVFRVYLCKLEATGLKHDHSVNLVFGLRSQIRYMDNIVWTPSKRLKYRGKKGAHHFDQPGIPRVEQDYRTIASDK